MDIQFKGLENIDKNISVPGREENLYEEDKKLKKYLSIIEENKVFYKEYQETIKLTEELRCDILKSINKNPNVTKELFLKAIKAISLACREPSFYNQIEKIIG